MGKHNEAEWREQALIFFVYSLTDEEDFRKKCNYHRHIINKMFVNYFTGWFNLFLYELQGPL
jgi:hypothetical protein